jgi:hypothetical protein
MTVMFPKRPFVHKKMIVRLIAEIEDAKIEGISLADPFSCDICEERKMHNVPMSDANSNDFFWLKKSEKTP